LRTSKVKIGFKAFDAHELLCHFVAVKAGLYAKENIDVELIDITFVAEADLPEDVFQASCGAALSSALRGFSQKIIVVATDRPMFWIYSNNSISSLEDLQDSRIATFPAIAPPHYLANIILGKHGIDVEQQVKLLPARDDTARFGLLGAAYVDAAVISSALSPVQIEQQGFNNLCFFGDEIRIPTTGLAVDQSFIEKEPELIRTLVGIYKYSLSLIASDPALVASVLEDNFNMADTYSKKTAAILAPYFSAFGVTSETIAQNAISSLCKSLSISSIPDWRQIYTFAD
jgi:ABC-type nitrate/sulfonate/bicarbonate transport system substrate-binding protein